MLTLRSWISDPNKIPHPTAIKEEITANEPKNSLRHFCPSWFVSEDKLLDLIKQWDLMIFERDGEIYVFFDDKGMRCRNR